MQIGTSVLRVWFADFFVFLKEMKVFIRRRGEERRSLVMKNIESEATLVTCEMELPFIFLIFLKH